MHSPLSHEWTYKASWYVLQVLFACPPLQQALSSSSPDARSRGPLGFALQQAFMHTNGKHLHSTA